MTVNGGAGDRASDRRRESDPKENRTINLQSAPERAEDRPEHQDTSHAAVRPQETDPSKLRAAAPKSAPQKAEQQPPKQSTDRNTKQPPAKRNSPAPAKAANTTAKPDTEPKKSNRLRRLKQRAAGDHTRREWLLLGERIFSHPRYAVAIIIALALCTLDKYWFVVWPLVVFFTVEWWLRFWLLKENGWNNKKEMGFLLLDGIATLSLFSTLFLPVEMLEQAFYLRLARLLRGMYLLRMLRVFRMFTHETFIYSLPFGMAVTALAVIGLMAERLSLYLGIVLLLELVARSVSIFRVLPDGKRRYAEILFLPVDLVASVALLGVVPGVSPLFVLLRLIRFMVLLNPLRNFAQALFKVLGMAELRKEAGMLLGVLSVMMFLVLISILYLYPQMDLNGDHKVTTEDYAPFQLLLFVVRMLMDPGVPPATAYSPWLVAITIAILFAGLFLFALMIDLGASFMQKLLEELANSPMTPREQMMMVGYNEQAMPILRNFDKLCGRLRRTFASIWVFYGEPLAQATTVGRWLAVRRAEPGERGLVRRFRLSGLQHLIIFHRHDNSEEEMQALVDSHHLAREAKVDTLVISDALLPPNKHEVFAGSLGAEVVVSASVMTRMLYQATHCSYMPEFGMRLLDAVEGETGMYAIEWETTIEPAGAGALMVRGAKKQRLDQWLSECFAKGINIIAGRTTEGRMILVPDLFRTTETVELTDMIGIGSEPSLWGGAMEAALGRDEVPHHNPLKTFSWPEVWDLNIIFLGWHPGLPAMLIEMALKHHKIAFNVFTVSDAEAVAEKQALLDAAIAEAGERTKCKISTSVTEWDGLDIDALTPKLRGCKLIMLYPEEIEGDGEDSVLELWLHRVGASLQARKEKTKWWTPPKLMVLPRSSDNIGTLVEAAADYPLIPMDVGSPDAFHDLYISRKMITHAWKLIDPQLVIQETKMYEMVELLLSDAVVLEMTSAEGLLAEPCESWRDIYREGIHRGWSLVGYVMPERPKDAPVDPFQVLESLFPLNRSYEGSRMHMLAGALVMEMDAPTKVDQLLFIRRGVLEEHGAQQSGDKKGAKKPPAKTAAKSPATAKPKPAASLTKAAQPSSSSATPTPTQQQKPAPKAPAGTQTGAPTAAEPSAAPKADAQKQRTQPTPQTSDRQKAQPAPAKPAAIEIVDPGEWPKQSDARLLRVLAEQCRESLQLLQQSSEAGLMKLMGLLESAPGEAVEAQIMEALGSLQNIDRVSQWVNNVISVLDDWSSGVTPISGEAGWMAALAKRYVMEEERDVLKRIMDADAVALETAVEPAPQKSADQASVQEPKEAPVEAAPKPEADPAEAASRTRAEQQGTAPVETDAEPAPEPEKAEAQPPAQQKGTAPSVETTSKPESQEIKPQAPSQQPAPAKPAAIEIVDPGEWPKQSDARLLRVLAEQCRESLQLLQQSSEAGLMKLMGLLESAPGEAVEAQIMEALGSLQNIDRVSQWVNNVISVLDDWSGGVTPISGEAGWMAALAKRYVMEEERDVLKRIMDADAVALETAVEPAPQKSADQASVQEPKEAPVEAAPKPEADPAEAASRTRAEQQGTAPVKTDAEPAPEPEKAENQSPETSVPETARQESHAPAAPQDSGQQEASAPEEVTPAPEPDPQPETQPPSVEVRIVGDWPVETDQRLLRIFSRQVEESLSMLQQSSEASLMKLMALLDSAPGEAVEGQIMAGLESLQNLDRVAQWLNNVRTCLDEWAEGVPACNGETPWRDAMLARCVMEEEREVVRAILDENS